MDVEGFFCFWLVFFFTIFIVFLWVNVVIPATQIEDLKFQQRQRIVEQKERDLNKRITELENKKQENINEK